MLPKRAQKLAARPLEHPWMPGRVQQARFPQSLSPRIPVRPGRNYSPPVAPLMMFPHVLALVGAVQHLLEEAQASKIQVGSLGSRRTLLQEQMNHTLSRHQTQLLFIANLKFTCSSAKDFSFSDPKLALHYHPPLYNNARPSGFARAARTNWQPPRTFRCSGHRSFLLQLQASSSCCSHCSAGVLEQHATETLCFILHADLISSGSQSA